MSAQQTAAQALSIAQADQVPQVRAYLLGLQARIMDALDAIEAEAACAGQTGTKSLIDPWSKAPGELLQGDGITRIIEGGQVFERAGCGFSHVRGPRLPPSATQHRPELAGAPFEAMGVSLVFHPRNPYVPTVHMNVRMIAARPADLGACRALDVESENAPQRDQFLPDSPPHSGAMGQEGGKKWAAAAHSQPTIPKSDRLLGPGAPAHCWFGGGMDLTPYYGFLEDVQHFHRCCRDALQPFGADKYPRFKQWCDEYFYLRHRGEQRGVGGIFFDDFAELGFAQNLALLQSVGDAFLGAYLPIVQRRRHTPWGERERAFQLYRRGRYVEFNLVWDRGTHFGLQSGGRTESILLSMPPLVAWSYQREDGPDTPEAALVRDFLQRRDWLAEAGAAGSTAMLKK